MTDLRRDATNTACGGTPQPLSEEAIALVLAWRTEQGEPAMLRPMIVLPEAKTMRLNLCDGGGEA